MKVYVLMVEVVLVAVYTTKDKALADAKNLDLYNFTITEMEVL